MKSTVYHSRIQSITTYHMRSIPKLIKIENRGCNLNIIATRGPGWPTPREHLSAPSRQFDLALPIACRCCADSWQGQGIASILSG